MRLHSSPSMRLWGLQLLLGFLAYLLGQIALLLTMVIGIGATGGGRLSSTSPTEVLSHPVAFLAGSIVGALVCLVAYRAAMQRLRRDGVPELAPLGALREIGKGLALGAAVVAISMGILALLGVYQASDIRWDTGALGGLGTGILAGVGEEILVRGTLQRILTGFVGPLWALGIISALFGASHILNAGATTLGIIAIALEAGLLLGGAYLLTGRLWLPIGIHIAWNAVQGGVFGSTISGIDGTRGLARASWSGPELLTGGTMGMEGSLVTVIVGLIVGSALLVMAHRQGRLTRAE